MSNPNPADPFLTRNDDPLSTLPKEARAALLKLGKAGGRLARGAFDFDPLALLLERQLVAPHGIGAVVEITGRGISALADTAGQAREDRRG